MSRSVLIALSLCLMSLAVPAKTTRGQSSSVTGAITGRVICEDGQMPLGLTVNIWSPGDRGDSQRVTLDESGRFQAAGLKPGTYFISAYAPGYTQDETTPRQRYYRIGDVANFRLKKGGVITGTVTDSNGEPVTGVQVRALRVRDADGRRIRALMAAMGKNTDDRGVYRIYGLPSGSYQLVTAPMFKAPSTASDTVAPTYYPSSTRDTAAEVPVQAGQEATNIDIRIRNESGHTVSGIVRGAIPQDTMRSRVWVSISHEDQGMAESSALTFSNENTTFSIPGLPDGNYVVSAQLLGQEVEAASLPTRVRVKGADVTGLELRVLPLGSISGRIRLDRKQPSDPSSECEGRREASFEESIISLRRDLAKDEPHAMQFSSPNTAPDDRGEFTIKGLQQARYRIEPQLPSETWYVRSITSPAPDGKTTDLSAGGVPVRQGDKVTGLTITVTEGAAAIRGKVIAAREGASLPLHLRVHLLPAEPESADDLLRYREIVVERDSTFALTNLAPGKYLLIALPAEVNESGIEVSQPVAWDIVSRKRLRSDAEAINALIDLKSCDRLSDYLLRYAPATTSRPTRKR